MLRHWITPRGQRSDVWYLVWNTVWTGSSNQKLRLWLTALATVNLLFLKSPTSNNRPSVHPSIHPLRLLLAPCRLPCLILRYNDESKDNNPSETVLLRVGMCWWIMELKIMVLLSDGAATAVWTMSGVTLRDRLPLPEADGTATADWSLADGSGGSQWGQIEHGDDSQFHIYCSSTKLTHRF